MQAIKELSSFLNTAHQAICCFKPIGFDFRKAMGATSLYKGGFSKKCPKTRPSPRKKDTVWCVPLSIGFQPQGWILSFREAFHFGFCLQADNASCEKSEPLFCPKDKKGVRRPVLHHEKRTPFGVLFSWWGMVDSDHRSQ